MWISHVPYSEATGRLKGLYDRVKGPDDNVDNIMLAHSLRPHSMEGHIALYKYVLHHAGNQVPKWFLEALGVYVSMLNGCAYCVDHHFSGLSRLVNDPARAAAIRKALEGGSFEGTFTDAEVTAIHYAEALTRAPQAQDKVKSQLDAMRKADLDDGRILEINQVVSYFSYANRTVLGLGVTTDGDILGLSPNNSDNQDDWNHR
jgi:uncharacterized peroxidase-related enzyme